MTRIENLLSFRDIDEKVINEELDNLAAEVLRLDLRGHIVDLLLQVKELRDKKIREFIDNNRDYMIADGMSNRSSPSKGN